MNLSTTFDCSGVDWSIVSRTLKRVGMAYCEPDVHRRAFENSHTSVFVYDGDQLVAFGRAISDDAYQAAVYDLAVAPEYQRQGIGVAILCFIETSKIIQGFRIAGMIRTEDFLSDSQSLLVERLGVGVTAPPLVKVSELG